jgi:hypothetical protein
MKYSLVVNFQGMIRRSIVPFVVGFVGFPRIAAGSAPVVG